MSNSVKDTDKFQRAKSTEMMTCEEKLNEVGLLKLKERGGENNVALCSLIPRSGKQK